MYPMKLQSLCIPNLVLCNKSLKKSLSKNNGHALILQRKVYSASYVVLTLINKISSRAVSKLPG